MFTKLFSQIKKYFKNTDVSSFTEHLAYQFRIVGENGGTFYVEVKDGELFVEPYDYFDSDATITTSEETVLRIVKGNLDPLFAHRVGLVNIVGDMEKVSKLREILSIESQLLDLVC